MTRLKELWKIPEILLHLSIFCIMASKEVNMQSVDIYPSTQKRIIIMIALYLAIFLINLVRCFYSFKDNAYTNRTKISSRQPSPE